MSEPTVELNALYRERNEVRHKVEGLEADVGILERRRKEAEAQSDSLKAQVQEWMEGSAQLQVKLGEAVGMLGRIVSAPREKGSALRVLLQIQDDAKDVLGGRSTVTPADWAGHLRERAEGDGKTVEELREQYGLDAKEEPA